MSRNNSVPGLDGISAVVWKRAVSPGQTVLLNLYRIVFPGGFFDDNVNFPSMAFITESGDVPDTSAICKEPKDLRPVCFSNVDHKILSAAIDRPLAQVASQTVSVSQKGVC